MTPAALFAAVVAYFAATGALAHLVVFVGLVALWRAVRQRMEAR